MAETERGNAASNEEESSVEMSNNNAIERGKGRPHGLKKKGFLKKNNISFFWSQSYMFY